MLTETDLMHSVCVELCRRGAVCFRTNSGLYYTKDGRPVRIGIPGQSDLQGHRPDGIAFYLEIKQPGQKPRKNQLEFLQAMRKSGALAGWADSVEKAVEIVFQNPKPVENIVEKVETWAAQHPEQ